MTVFNPNNPVKLLIYIYILFYFLFLCPLLVDYLVYCWSFVDLDLSFGLLWYCLKLRLGLCDTL
jgi:hypothetical protein